MKFEANLPRLRRTWRMSCFPCPAHARDSKPQQYHNSSKEAEGCLQTFRIVATRRGSKICKVLATAHARIYHDFPHELTEAVTKGPSTPLSQPLDVNPKRGMSCQASGRAPVSAGDPHRDEPRSVNIPCPKHVPSVVTNGCRCVDMCRCRYVYTGQGKNCLTEPQEQLSYCATVVRLCVDSSAKYGAGHPVIKSQSGNGNKGSSVVPDLSAK